MADRTSAAAQTAALSDLRDAARAYLNTVGWTAVQVARPRVEQRPGTPAYHFQIVIECVGDETRELVGP